MFTSEWSKRLDHWRKAMPERFFVSLGEIPLETFTTFEQLSREKALQRLFQPMAVGTKWGSEWEYAWFRGHVRVPESARGERIALRADTGRESIIWINGKEIGAKGWSDREITLTPCAAGGEEFEIVLETYAGNAHWCHWGPWLPNRLPEQLPDGDYSVPSGRSAELKQSQFGIWEEELYQLWIDVETLAQLASAQKDSHSLRIIEINDALRRMTQVVDLELPRAEMLTTVRQGRDVLRPLLDARNGTSAPGMFGFGHAHIDIAWLWPLQETERKCARTFSSQLTLMDQYPEYKFLQSQPHLYRMTKRLYPELYARIRDAAQRGQWIVDGAMWVEPDTNVTGGESLIRQFLHGKRFFKEEFGVDSRLMWLPDVFGYSGAIPQIMQGCRVDYFSTQKILWTYNGGDRFPYNWFWWEGIDGTRVLSYIHNDYNSQTNPQSLAARWSERSQTDSFHRERLLPFGWGDGGGGPTRNHLEFLRRQVDLQDSPRCRIGAPEEFFDAMCRNERDLAQVPVWVGELYFQCHRGTYTSQARTKRGNRLSETQLREAELWGAAASALRNEKFPLAEIDSLWKDVLLNQFHDILPGSSVHRVYVEAEKLYATVLKQTVGLTQRFLSTLTKADSSAITVFNSLSWEREELVELPDDFAGAVDANGVSLPIQSIAGKNVTRVSSIPSMGWTTVRRSPRTEVAIPNAVTVTDSTLENEFLRLTLNVRGEIVSLWDKQAQREFAAEPCNSLHLYKDVPAEFDAWDIDSTYKVQPVELPNAESITIGERGPLLASLRITRRLSASMLTQEIILRAGSRRIDFRTRIDWHEKHKLLKVNFPVSVHSDTAMHEIQFGHLHRPTHSNRLADAMQFEVCNQKWTALAEENRGVAVLNNCKYGVNVEHNSINLTLLRAPIAPDPTADEGAHEFIYSFLCWSGVPFSQSGVVAAGYELNMPVQTTLGDAAERSLFTVSESNIVIETVKPAEDGSGDVIVRLYESMRTITRTVLSTSLPFKQAQQTNMLEEQTQALALTNGQVELDFRPFEIKTIRFST